MHFAYQITVTFSVVGNFKIKIFVIRYTYLAESKVHQKTCFEGLNLTLKVYLVVKGQITSSTTILNRACYSLLTFLRNPE